MERNNRHNYLSLEENELLIAMQLLKVYLGTEKVSFPSFFSNNAYLGRACVFWHFPLSTENGGPKKKSNEKCFEGPLLWLYL